MRSGSPVNSSDENGTPGFQADAARAWLDLLHGNARGLINICSTGNWTGRCFESDQLDEAVAYAAMLQRGKPDGIYVRTTTLASEPEQGKRGSIEDSLELPGFALDLDLAGPGHSATMLPPDVATAQAIVNEAGLPEPTLWVHSGGGVYPWWVLNEPADLTDPAQQSMSLAVARGLDKIVKHTCDTLGWDYGTGIIDLARVLRLPGTVNHKTATPRPCHIIDPATYTFYDIEDLYSLVKLKIAALPEAARVEAPRPESRPIQISDDISPGDAFDRTAHWADILTPHGWDYLYSRGSTMYWRRPGKTTQGHSATTGRASDRDRLYVFSGDAYPFEANQVYNKFAAYALLNHGGDFSAASRQLRSDGFGGQRPQQHQSTNLSSLVRPEGARGTSTEVKVVGSQQVQAVEQGNAVSGPLVLDHEGLPVYSGDILTRHKWRDTGIIDMYVDAFGDGLKYLKSQDEWMIWDGKRWKNDSTERSGYAAQQLLRALEAHADQAYDSGNEAGKNLVESAKKLCTFAKMSQLPNLARKDPKIADDFTNYDKTSDVITVDNGTLNLVTRELTPFDPSLKLTKKLAAAYDPDATCERLDAFHASLMPDPEVRAYVKRCVGATLLGRADERIIMFLYGDSGSGKSAFLEMLVSMFGDFAAVADEATFKPGQDDRGPTDRLHKLKGSRLVKMSELAEGSTLNQSLIKNVTGLDTQSTRPLYGQLVEWKVQYVAWLATNHLPRLSSNDAAIWKRVKPIHFPNTFVDADGQVLNSADRDLGQQLFKSSSSAILNWMLEGLAEYLEIGLSEPAVIGQWLGQYRDEVDTTRQFVTEAAEADQITVAEGEQAGVRELYRVYTAWCADMQVKPVAANNFTTRMESNGWKRVKREQGMRWQGIGIKGFIGQAQTPSSPSRYAPDVLRR